MSDASLGEPTAKPLPPIALAAVKPETDRLAPPAPTEKPTPKRRWWTWVAGGVLALLALIEGIPWVITALRTVSTDDAYVNGHVTQVAPRVPGQVVRVLVDDNNRVHKGDLLVQLDKEPYQVQLSIAQSAVSTAQADVIAAHA